MNERTGGRSRRLIQPSLQLKLIGSFVGLTALALMGQFLMLGQRLKSAAAELEGAGGQLAQEIPGMLLTVLGVSLMVMLPLIGFLGVILTLRVAGPVYRFESYLKSVIRGEQLGPCRLREGDELQDLCALINEATLPLRRGEGREAPQHEPAGEEPWAGAAG